MPSINWRDASAWPMSPQDRALLEKLRSKVAAGEELLRKKADRRRPLSASPALECGRGCGATVEAPPND